MEPQDPSKPVVSYNPFWYSVDLFVPLTRLHATNMWRPKSDRWWTWHYLRIHHLLGWILIPLGLAAITGLVK